MSQFDQVTFAYRMPDGTNGPHYQTKDLRFAMDMACYEVSPSGRLIRTHSDFDQPLGDLACEHTIFISAEQDLGGSYELRFRRGTLHEIHCFQTGITAPFIPPESR